MHGLLLLRTPFLGGRGLLTLLQVVVVENKKQLDKFTAISQRLPKLKALVVWDGTMEEIATAAASAACAIYTWKDFIRMGGRVHDHQLTARIKGEYAAYNISHRGREGGGGEDALVYPSIQSSVV